MTLPHIVSIGFTCADLQATSTFFREGLGGAVIRLQRLAIGADTLELTQVVDPGPGIRPGRPIPADSRSNDLWFQHICLVVSDLEQALERLRAVRPSDGSDAISVAPQRLPAGLEPGRRGHPGLQTPRSRGPSLRVAAVPTRQGRPPLAGAPAGGRSGVSGGPRPGGGGGW